MATRKLTVSIVGDSRDLERAFARSTKAAKKFSVGIGGIGRSLTGVFAGVAALGGATSLIRASFAEMNEANKVAAQTNAVLESTGQIAGVTAGHVEKLADSLLRTTGIDDELIQSAENLLLTFTNVRNVVGANNDIFDQATRSTLDLSVAMDTDLQSAAKMIGKALNDPVKGATALRRAGVQLSAQQEKQIRTFVKNGRMLEAQKLLLEELETQLGGSAEAAGKVQPWNRLRNTILNITGEMARVLLPSIERVTKRLQAWFDNTENVARLQAGFTATVGTLGAVISTVADAASRFAGAVGGWKNALAIVVGAWAGFRAAGIGSAIAVMSANLVAAGAVQRAWQAALISTGWGALAVAAGIAAAYVVTHWEKVKVWFQQFWKWLEHTANRAALKVVEPFSHIPTKGGEWARDLKAQIQWNMQQIEKEAGELSGKAGAKAGESFAERYERELREAMAKLTKVKLAEPPGGGGGGGGASAGGLTAAERAARRNQWFDADVQRRLNRLQDLGLRKQLAGLRAVEDTLRARLAITKDRTRQLALSDQILDVEREQRSVQEQIGEQVKKTNEALRERHENRLFRALGLGPGGAALVPGVEALRRRLGRTQDALKGTALDTDKMRARLRAMRKVLADPFTRGAADVRNTIEKMLADIDRKLDERRGARQHFRAASTDQLLAGMGLTPAQMRIARARIAGAAGGKVPLGGAAAFGMRLGPGVTVVNVNGNVVTPDSDKFIRDMQKRAKRTRAQQRGVRPGVALGGA